MKILGHPRVVRYLVHGLRKEILSPSLLFVGPEGVGKKAVARELAKAFFCNEKGGPHAFVEECACPACRKVDSNHHPDFFLITLEIQATMLGEKKETQTAVKIESVRQLEKFLQLKPLEGKRRVAVVEDAEKMTIEAANALLKVLEEPPRNAQIVLLASHLRNFPATIPSRCGVVRFSAMPQKDLARWLVEFHQVPFDEAEDVAEKAGGSFSRAMELKGSEKQEEFSLDSFDVDEFFGWLQESVWKKEGKSRAAQLLQHLIRISQRKLESGQTSEVPALETLLRAQDQLARHVPPKLVLENLFLKLKPVFEEGVRSS